MTFDRQRMFLARLLYLFAAWTLTIKYVLPVSWALIQKQPLATFIYFWDAWWIAHILVGLGLERRKKGTWWAALILSLAEIVIIVAKFWLYLRGPNLDFWHVNWFVNKCFLLGYFVFLLFWLMKKQAREKL